MQRGEKEKVIRIPIKQIAPNPQQPRKQFDEEKLWELAESIKENGLIQPITVRKNFEDRYEIVTGERRFRAAKMAGYQTIPCLLSDCGEKQSAEIAMIENMQRCDLDPFEEAAAIKNLMDIFQMNQEETAKRLGKSSSALANKLRLLRLLEDERELIRKNGLSERHARALLKIKDQEERKKVLVQIIAKNLNVKQTESYIDRILQEKDTKKQKKKFILKDIRIFFNTIDHAVETVKLSGLCPEMVKRETEDYVECLIKIPKKNPV